MSEYVIPKEYKELYEEWKLEYLFKLVGKGDDDREVFDKKIRCAIFPIQQVEIDYEKQAKICLDHYNKLCESGLRNSDIEKKRMEKEPSKELKDRCDIIFNLRNEKLDLIFNTWKNWIVEEKLIIVETYNGSQRDPKVTISKKGFDLIYKEK